MDWQTVETVVEDAALAHTAAGRTPKRVRLGVLERQLFDSAFPQRIQLQGKSGLVSRSLMTTAGLLVVEFVDVPSLCSVEE